ncbi:ACT domain-containing protein [Limibaculum sp. M0105]|uniref:ACT domain-containing protein n=1 Tax=Thermohalobaculum xanthum TaxID=2753746 RepID=A0A8J7M6L1_9RHOB|nr:ACT domain-containing protein [Thermohalobaculum xanthum]MBK0399299.1 ACT domain-containing protein [Thermohalobaculum xanthum]
MTGETDLAVLLRGMRPVLDPVVYGFSTLQRDATLPPALRPLCLFEEEEGTTLIAPQSDLVAAGLAHRPGWARITLTVHSSLEAVGLTAAIAAALTDAGISANVVAAYYHDHVFVPWDRRHDALTALEALGQN